MIEGVAPDWKDLAIALGFDHSRIMIIEEDCQGRVERSSQEMFMRWLDGEYDLVQPCTWDTLIKCLRCAAFFNVHKLYFKGDSKTVIIIFSTMSCFYILGITSLDHAVLLLHCVAVHTL